MSKRIVPRLSVMMFLQYAVWGAWLPLAARFLGSSPENGGLGFDGYQIGMILGLAGSIGAVAAPFIAGQIADRYFRTEHCLAVLLIAGGIIKWITAEQTSFGAWLILSIAYSVVYMPTLALSNSLAFTHLADRDRQFPQVRLWGTIGWAVSGWVFSLAWLKQELGFTIMPPFLDGPDVPAATARIVDSLKFCALASFGYAVYCLTLPATAPKREGVEPLAFAKAFRLFRHPSFAVLVGASLLVSVIHQIYFLQASPFLASIGVQESNIAPAMTIGQLSEIVVMVALGWMLKGLGFRKVIFLGALAYFGRYLIWSATGLPKEILVASQALHGVCYACFFAAAYIYVDRIASTDVRHSAQTVFGILILGGGPVIGGYLSGFLQETFQADGGALDFGSFWMTLSMLGLATAVLVLVFFRDETGDRLAAR
ncbi:MAG: MFS transporter [Planctomycetota bacterium]